MLTIENVERGCGKLVPGGLYLQGGMAPGGALCPSTWALDFCTTDAPEAFAVEVPPRAMVQIDPLASFVTRSLVTAGSMADVALVTAAGLDLSHLALLGRFGLADHVGENNYTPWSFFQELAAQGPSRRVPASVALEVARHLPCPILFFMPLPIIGTTEDVIAWLDEHYKYGRPLTMEPTWYDPNWTFLTREYDGGPRLLDAYHGDDHFMCEVLEHANSLDPAERVHFGTPMEMPFAVSVITRAAYILNDDEDDLPEELQGSGVQPARLVPASEEGEETEDA